jgi:hypothetical protein
MYYLIVVTESNKNKDYGTGAFSSAIANIYCSPHEVVDHDEDLCTFTFPNVYANATICGTGRSTNDASLAESVINCVTSFWAGTWNNDLGLRCTAHAYQVGLKNDEDVEPVVETTSRDGGVQYLSIIRPLSYMQGLDTMEAEDFTDLIYHSNDWSIGTIFSPYQPGYVSRSYTSGHMQCDSFLKLDKESNTMIKVEQPGDMPLIAHN